MKKTIVVVDDEQDILALLGKILAREAYSILLARNSQELFLLLKDIRPDLILLDVMMPGISGFEVCQQLKNDPRTASIPVVLLTVLDSPEDVRKGKQSGASAYLTKPFDPVELDREIKAVLRRAGEVRT